MKGLTGKVSLALLLVYILVDANTPVPGRASYGTSINSPALWRDSQRTFVVATYNIRRSKGNDGKRDIERSARVLRDSGADIVGLNELSGTWFYGFANQAQQMGELLEAGWLFAPTHALFFQPYFGNGLISYFPVSFWEIHPLVSDEDSFRNMIVARVAIGQNDVHIVNTHLDRGDQRQLRQVLGYFSALPSPAVLMGDFNASHNDRTISDFLKKSDYIDATHVVDGNHDVEWIISKGLVVVSGGSEQAGISDHPAYWVEFAMPGITQGNEPDEPEN